MANDVTLPPEIDHRIEEVLVKWWSYETSYRGTPRDAKASTIYGGIFGSHKVFDSASEMLDEDVDLVLVDAVCGAVLSLSREHRESIEIKMMCITSAAVWQSNRLGPRLEFLYVESKQLLLPLLRKRRVEI